MNKDDQTPKLDDSPKWQAVDREDLLAALRAATAQYVAARAAIAAIDAVWSQRDKS